MQQKYRQIWSTIALVPRGCVASYGQIADLAGLPGRARLVGKALGLAPESEQLPWHRILRSSGQLAFSALSESAIEQTRKLQSEGVRVVRNKVDLKTYQWIPTMDDLLLRLKH